MKNKYIRRFIGIFSLLVVFSISGCSSNTTTKATNSVENKSSSKVVKDTVSSTDTKTDTKVDMELKLEKEYSSWDKIPKELSEEGQIWRLQKATLMSSGTIKAIFLKKEIDNIYNGELTKIYQDWSAIPKEISENDHTWKLVRARLIDEQIEAVFKEK